MDAHELGMAIARGERGSDGHFPSNWGGLRAHRGQVVAFGDATANARHMSGPNSWTIIDQVFRDVLRDPTMDEVRYWRNLPDTNPLVHFRVRSVNAKFESASGTRSAWVDQRCEQLIADFNVVRGTKTERIFRNSESAAEVNCGCELISAMVSVT